MKKVILLLAVVAMPIVLSACTQTCETEPIVAENHKLIVPPHFGQMPKEFRHIFFVNWLFYDIITAKNYGGIS